MCCKKVKTYPSIFKKKIMSHTHTSIFFSVSHQGEKYSGIIICVSSHGDLEDPYGDYNEIIHAKDMPYPKEELWKYFEAKEAWKDKPILIFIQACRGADPTPGVMYTHDVGEQEEPEEIKFTIPKYPNLFIMNASQPGTVSFRWNDTTPFIEAFIDVLKERAMTWDLISIATQVCHQVAVSFEACNVNHEHYECSLQMPCFETTLTKKFYLPIRDSKEEVFLKEYELEKKGLALIFLYDYEDTDLQTRSSVNYDKELLQQTLSSLNFDIECHRNMKFNDLVEKRKSILPRNQRQNIYKVFLFHNSE